MYIESTFTTLLQNVILILNPTTYVVLNAVEWEYDLYIVQQNRIREMQTNYKNKFDYS